jgi:hypothetical protein
MQQNQNQNSATVMQAHLAQSSFGRIVLHVLCLCRDHNYQWHWRGIVREFVCSPR